MKLIILPQYYLYLSTEKKMAEQGGGDGCWDQGARWETDQPRVDKPVARRASVANTERVQF